MSIDVGDAELRLSLSWRPGDIDEPDPREELIVENLRGGWRIEAPSQGIRWAASRVASWKRSRRRIDERHAFPTRHGRSVAGRHRAPRQPLRVLRIKLPTRISRSSRWVQTRRGRAVGPNQISSPNSATFCRVRLQKIDQVFRTLRATAESWRSRQSLNVGSDLVEVPTAGAING